MRYLIVVILTFLPPGLYSQNPDINLLRRINSPEDLGADEFSRIVSGSTYFISAGLPAGLAVAGLVKEDDKMFRSACFLAAASAVTFGVTTGLKYAINRDRPFTTYTDITQKSDVISPSFPSGHTSAAFSTATYISMEYPEWYFIVPSYLWAASVAYSRMELGVHYPSDVLAGAVIGAGTAFVSHMLNKKLNERRKYKPCNCPN